MFERFTPEARTLVALASEHARRLGHRYVGGEHILLAAVGADQPASAVLRAHGVTPELVEEEIVRRVGLGAGAGLFGGLDKDALATIGIDLDAVRARIEASFGPQALARAGQAAHRDLRRRPAPRPPR
ncbi:MAG: Clp protease N-terminal domain-containing protein, partial [Streptosporangiaceae bacterium]